MTDHIAGHSLAPTEPASSDPAFSDECFDPGGRSGAGGPNGAARLRMLDALAELVVQRLVLGQDVAAAKYATGRPIDDPIREQEILHSVARALNGLGSSQEAGLRFFRDQIEANKVVQRGLHQRWLAHPEEVPAVPHSLEAQVRPKFDRITKQMLRQLKAIGEMPHFRFGCIQDLVEDKFRAGPSPRQLPSLQRSAAVFALRSFCAG